MFDIENPSLKALNDSVKNQGFNETALRRVLFRLNYIDQFLKTRAQFLKNGNIADLSAEVFMTDELVRDLVDVVRETVSLIHFREEQGLISPPNAPAGATETPPVA